MADGTLMKSYDLRLYQMISQNAIFQDNNARPHHARIGDKFLQLNSVQRFEWPPFFRSCHAFSAGWIFLVRQSRGTLIST